MFMSTLADVPVGQSARIRCLQGEESVIAELRELGFCEGENVTVKKTAPFKDPIVLEVLNYRLSIRRSDARGICVEQVL